MAASSYWRHLSTPSIIAGGLAAVLAFAAGAPANAYTLYVEQSGGTSSNNGNPNDITNDNNFYIGEQSGGVTLTNPLLVIVGVYDSNSSASAPKLTFDGSNVSLATAGTYGLTANSANFTASSGGGTATAYSLLGLAAAEAYNVTGAETYSAWSSEDQSAVGPGAPTSVGYELFAYALNTSLGSDSAISLGISGAPDGSFLIAYSCVNAPSAGDACTKPIAQTLSNDAGMVDAPEPASLTLFGTLVAGLWGASRRRRRLA